MNLRIVILEAKKLANGTHKIRIAISHNSQTRYIPTRFVVPSIKNLRDGNVIGVPNASYINQQLRTQISKIYKICDSIENIDYYSCSNLVSVIKNKEGKNSANTLEEIAFEMFKVKESSWATDSCRIFRNCLSHMVEYFGKGFILSVLDSAGVIGYAKFLKTAGYSSTTISIRMNMLRRIVFFAKNHGFVKYEVEPFIDYKESVPVIRELSIPIEKIRTIRDAEINDKWTECARDIFMLSFYLAGMNLGDILAQDFRKQEVKFIRQKTRSRRNPNDFTEFTIQPEARRIIDKYITENGKLKFFGRETKKSIYHIVEDYMKKLRGIADFDKLVLYSARKSFAQIANELMIKDSLIEYCLGDAVTNRHRAINFYIKINKRMADKAIRKVLDALASDKKMEELIAEVEI